MGENIRPKHIHTLHKVLRFDPQPIPDEIQLMLCRVRQTVKQWPERMAPYVERSTCGGPYGRWCYVRFMRETAPEVNSTNTLDELQDLGVWRNMTGDEILEELRGCSDGCRKLFERHINRYLGAAWAYLLDIVPDDQYERLREAGRVTHEDIPGGDEHEMFLNKFYAERPNLDWHFCGWFPTWSAPHYQHTPSEQPVLCQIETVLFQRIFVIQKIQALLSDADGAAVDRFGELNRAGELGAVDELFQALDNWFIDEEKKRDATPYLPSNSKQGNKKKGTKKKYEYLDDLRKKIYPESSSTEYFGKRFDAWAKERFPEKTDKENG